MRNWNWRRLFGDPTRRVPLDPAAVCRDQDVLDAIHAGDYDRARTIASAEFVELLVSPQFAEALLSSWAGAGRRR